MPGNLASGQPTCAGNIASRKHHRADVDDIFVKEGNDDVLKGRTWRRHHAGLVGGNETHYSPRPIRYTTESANERVAEVEYEDQWDNVEGERRHRFRWYCRNFQRVTEMAARTLLLGIVLLVTPGERVFHNAICFLFTTRFDELHFII